jgi:hypothetical protein
MIAREKMLHNGSAEEYPQDGWKPFNFLTILGSGEDAVRYMVYFAPDLGTF